MSRGRGKRCNVLWLGEQDRILAAFANSFFDSVLSCTNYAKTSSS